MADNGSDKQRVVNERFQVKSGDTIVTLGINPEKGGLSVYGWTDANGYHSLGRFPTTKYSSQWKAMAAVIPAIMQFIAYDERQSSPRLAVKSAKGIGMGETIEFNAVETLDELLNADGEAI